MKKDNQIAQEIFADSLDVPTRERSAFLDEACHGDPTLRRDVEGYLMEDKQAGGFLRSPLVDPTIDLHPIEVADSLLKRSTARFSQQDLINGRFRVVCFIARGGMGEVYEVEDTLLHNARVALKIIRPEIASNHGAAQRFEQELLMARRVVHPNLCPIYELFHCQEAELPFLFMTMKLLKGQPLDLFLKKSPPLTVEQVHSICEGMTAAVGALHAADIVHRDLKPSNVMVDPSGSRLSATIMDFGLARDLENHSAISQTGFVAGTPGYIAPEIMQGGRPTAASDLFALGILLHELVTGAKPIRVKNGLEVCMSKQLYSFGQPEYITRAIKGLTASDPRVRKSAFEQLSESLGIRRSRDGVISRRGFSLGACATLCGLVSGTIWKRDQISNAIHPLPLRRFVALLNWPPPSDGKVTPVLLDLIDRMANSLARAEAFDHNFFVACQDSLTEMKTPAQLNEVCESLGTNLVLGLAGALTPQGISVVLRVLTADSSRVLRVRKFYVSRSDQANLPEVTTRAAAELLDIGFLGGSGVNQIVTTSPEARIAFQTAQALLKEPNNGGLYEAIEKLKAAVEADPHFAFAHARLAFAYQRLFEKQHDSTSLVLARANAETALTLDPGSVEGHAALASIYEDTGKPLEALREYAKALSHDPTNSTVIIRQARVYFNLNRWQEAEEACKRVLRARPNLWEAYNGLGAIQSFQGKYQGALEAFQAASVTAPRNAITIANAAQMMFFLGDLGQAEAALSRSIALAPLAWTLAIRADIRRFEGKVTESLQAAIEATALDPKEDTAWLRVGDAYARMKHHDGEATESYRRALSVKAEQLRIDASQGGDWMQMALYEVQTGDKSSAVISMKEAEERNAVDIYSLLTKTRTLVLLGAHADALNTLAKCLRMGATHTQISSINDVQHINAT